MISYHQKRAQMNLYFDKRSFYVGEFIKGSIEINLDSVGLITGVLIEIFSNEMWKIKDYKEINNNMANSMNDRKLIIRYNLELSNFQFKKIDSNYLIPQGTSFIPFNFRFSEENFPVFEYPLNDKRAYSRYDFTVTINSPYIFGATTSLLCLISRPIIDSNLTKSIIQHVYKWNIFDRGETLLEVNLPENNFKYDSKGTINITIDNTRGLTAVKEYKFMFIRRIKFKNKLGEIKYTDETNIVSERVNAYVAMGHKHDFQYNLNFKEKKAATTYNYNNELNPYNINMEEINYYMPTYHGTLITCDYEIKVSVYYDVFVGYKYRPRVIMPIYLVHQLPLDYQMEIQEQIEYEKAIKNSIIDDNNKIKVQKSNNNIQKINQINNEEIMPKIKFNNVIKNDVKNFDEEDDLPSLEDIKESKKKKELEENNLNNINEECPPGVMESAPFPLQFKNENNRINNAYPEYNPKEFNNLENYDKNFEKNINNNSNENNYNEIKEEQNDFSLFNNDNNNSFNKKESFEENNNERDFKDINEI